MYEKSNTETFITICKIDSQWEFAVWLRKLKQGLCINLEGWDGEGNGTPLQYSSLENPMDGGPSQTKWRWQAPLSSALLLGI